MNTHVALLGDSIFDNAPYVGEGESVSEQLVSRLGIEVSLLAVDGDVTTDIATQLQGLPSGVTNLFLSCGGNDALRAASILHEEASSVSGALELLHGVAESFRANYASMLEHILGVDDRLVACTVYNRVPGLDNAAAKALALFNEVILEETFDRGVSLIDLRLVLRERDDYSAVSPIEPSKHGGKKLVDRIARVLHSHDYSSGEIRVYT